MNSVRIAVAGAGLIGLRHIEEIQKSRVAELASIVDVSPKAAEVAAAGRRAALRVARGAVREGPAGRRDHRDAEPAARRAGARVRRGRRTDAGREADRAHTGRRHPALRSGRARGRAGCWSAITAATARSCTRRCEVVRSGILGPLVGVIGSAVFYKPDSEGYYDGPNAWRRQPGGGPILINMIHEVGSLRAMVGEIVAVQAFASNATRGFRSRTRSRSTCASTTARWARSCSPTPAASPKSWEQTSQENKAYPTYDDEDAYTIIGTRGSLGVPTMRLKYYEKDEDRSWYKPFTTRTVPLRARGSARAADRAFRGGDPRRGRAARNLPRRAANLRVTEAIAEAGAARDGSSARCGDGRLASHRVRGRHDQRQDDA